MTSQHKDLTSQHKDLTSQHKYLTSQHNNLTSDGRNMPPYIVYFSTASRILHADRDLTKSMARASQNRTHRLQRSDKRH